MRLLYISQFLEYPITGGPQLRVSATIKTLSAISDLFLVSTSTIDHIGGKKAVRYYKNLSKKFSFTENVAPGIKFKVVAAISNVLHKVGIHTIGRVRDDVWITSYIKSNKIDVVWISYANLSLDLLKAIRSVYPKIIIISDTDSVWSRFVSRGNEILKNHSTIDLVIESKKIERGLLELSDIVTAVSEVDAKYYKNISKYSAKVKLFPNYIDMTIPNEVRGKIGKHFPKIGYILLPGSYGPNSPMEDAAQWLLNQIMPIVWKTHPETQVVLAGKGSELAAADKKNRNIVRTGKVNNMAPYLVNASMVVVPLRFESGTRYKIIEAGKYYKSVVSTSLGAEGLSLKNKQEIVIANKPNTFAKGIIYLIDNPKESEKIGQSLNKIIKNKYSLKQAKVQAKELLTGLV